jgi:hypothetical protein
MADVLFPVRNLFYLGSYQGAINEAQNIDTLSGLDSIERDVFVYRSYIALGSAQVRGKAGKESNRTIHAGFNRSTSELILCAASDQRGVGLCCSGSYSCQAVRRVSKQDQKQGGTTVNLFMCMRFRLEMQYAQHVSGTRMFWCQLACWPVIMHVL